jgi:hypothetical protein
VDPKRIRSFVPKMYEQLFGEPIAEQVLQERVMPVEVIRRLAKDSSVITALDCEQICSYVATHGKTRRW